MKTRLAYLFEFPTVSGGENSICELLKRLDRSRYEPIAFCPVPSLLSKKLEGLGIPTFDHGLPALKREPSFTHDKFSHHLVKLFTQHKIDLIHANSLSMAVYSGLVSSLTQIPAIAHVRDMIRLGEVKRNYLLMNRILITVSEACKHWLTSQGFDGHKVETIYNGIDIALLDPDTIQGTLRQELDLSDEAILMGNLGQIIIRKGQNHLLEAAIPLIKKYPQVHLVIAGMRHAKKQETVDYEAALHQSVKTADLEDRVHFLGWRDDVPQILKSLDFLVHTALQEPLGRVLLESMAMENPVIATDVGGTREIVIPETGCLVHARDTEELFHAMETLVCDAPLRKQMGHAGRKRIESVFVPEEMTQKITAFYESFLDEKPPTPNSSKSCLSDSKSVNTTECKPLALPPSIKSTRSSV